MVDATRPHSGSDALQPNHSPPTHTTRGPARSVPLSGIGFEPPVGTLIKTFDDTLLSTQGACLVLRMQPPQREGEGVAL